MLQNPRHPDDVRHYRESKAHGHDDTAITRIIRIFDQTAVALWRERKTQLGPRNVTDRLNQVGRIESNGDGGTIRCDLKPFLSIILFGTLPREDHFVAGGGLERNALLLFIGHQADPTEGRAQQIALNHDGRCTLLRQHASIVGIAAIDQLGRKAQAPDIRSQRIR